MKLSEMYQGMKVVHKGYTVQNSSMPHNGQPFLNYGLNPNIRQGKVYTVRSARAEDHVYLEEIYGWTFHPDEFLPYKPEPKEAHFFD